MTKREKNALMALIIAMPILSIIAWISVFSLSPSTYDIYNGFVLFALPLFFFVFIGTNVLGWLGFIGVALVVLLLVKNKVLAITIVVLMLHAVPAILFILMRFGVSFS